MRSYIEEMTLTMPRRTIYLPQNIEDLVREHTREGDSFSATVARLVELGAAEDIDRDIAVDESEFPLGYIGSWEGPGDLGINAEKYLGLKPWGPGEGPADAASSGRSPAAPTTSPT